MHGRIKALHPRMKLAGTAFTVEVRPGDNLMIHAAIALARPGDVIVVDGKGDQSSALMGTIMMSACRKRGIAGVVIDGATRDAAEIEEMGYPVFAAAAAVRSVRATSQATSGPTFVDASRAAAT